MEELPLIEMYSSFDKLKLYVDSLAEFLCLSFVKAALTKDNSFLVHVFKENKSVYSEVDLNMIAVVSEFSIFGEVDMVNF